VDPVRGWLGTRPQSSAKQFLAEHAIKLLTDATNVALDEIACVLSQPSATEPFRVLLDRACRFGIEAAYRPLLTEERRKGTTW
jgi:hypothetical protein